MIALRFERNCLSIAEVPRPWSAGEALVRVIKSGICNTDLEIVRGYAGFEGTIGHEFVGIVEESADAPEYIGRRVVGEINAGCGLCSICKSGDPRHCTKRTVLGIVGRDGAHAEYLRLPSRNLIEVPAGVTDDQAVFAEPLAAAFGINELVAIKKDTKLIIVGDGKLGLLCALTLSLSSEDVTLIGKHSSKIAIAGQQGVLGVKLDQIDRSMYRTADVVVEASGSESGFLTALDLVRPRGKIVLKSTFQGAPSWPASRIVVDEITIVGSRCGRLSDALRLLENGAVRVEGLIDDEFTLSQGIEAMRRAAAKGSLKILLRP